MFALFVCYLGIQLNNECVIHPSMRRIFTLVFLTVALVAGPVSAERIVNKVATFSGIDKITGRIITFDVYINETVQFGKLEITPRVCYSRSADVKPKTTTFAEIDEILPENQLRRIFNGWMFAESPGLNAVEHAVNDVWLVACKQESQEAPPPVQDS